MPEIKAIETRYKGYRMRSRLEARWAVALDTMGVKWEYEKEGYDLGEVGYYLPDFWLSELNAFAEVKPGRFSPDEINKVVALAEGTGFPVLLLCGMPTEGKTHPYIAGRANDGGLKIATREMSPNEIEVFALGFKIKDFGHKIALYLYPGANAINAARAARFEHGESG